MSDQVARYGLGAGTLSFAEGPESFSASLESAWSRGVRLYDTAPLYLAGGSEEALGSFLRPRRRDEFTVSTKVGRLPDRHGEPGWSTFRRFDYSRAATRSSVHTSLRRLGVDHLDTVYVHDVDRAMHDDFDSVAAEVAHECLAELEQLRDEGVLERIGVSTRQSDVGLQFAADGRVDALIMAGSYSLLGDEPLTELLPYCQEQGVDVVIASPLAGGLLATERTTDDRRLAAGEDTMARKEALVAVCRAHGVELIQLALQFPLAHPAITAIVVGHKNARELEQNLDAFELPVPAALWPDLVDRGLIAPESAARIGEGGRR